MSQEQRDRVMGRLRSGTAELLVATDVAARGLDVEQLTHVVNYDVPSAPESYVHRIGRVGRAGREGVAITLAEPREHRMLKTIERVTGQRIAIDKIPTVADMRTRRLELTQAALRESLLEDDLDPYRAIVESLTDEFDLVEVALAAVRLAHEATSPGSDDEEEIPQVSVRGPKEGRPEGRGERRPGRPRTGGTTQVFIGLGRRAGVRPQDLVGAITGETGINGRDIGSIEIADRFSLVEVPIGVADDVISGLRGSTIKGRKATVRRDRDGDGGDERRFDGGDRRERRDRDPAAWQRRERR
jgi:ATP-dependent RNA helicase DeaD